MPVISVSMTKENGGLSKAQKQKLISGLTSAFVDVVGRGDKTCVKVLLYKFFYNFLLNSRIQKSSQMPKF